MMDTWMIALIRRAQFRLVRGRQLKPKITERYIIPVETALLNKANMAHENKQLSMRKDYILSAIEHKNPVKIGPKPALSSVSWPPLKVYNNPPIPQNFQEADSEIERLKREIAILEHEADILWKIILRLRGEIRFQVRFWQDGLERGEWKTPSAMKRHLSGLKGALRYMREYYPKDRKVDDESID